MTQPSEEQQEVYELSEKLSDEVWLSVEQWHYFAKDTVGKQLIRAVDRIGASIAEGVGRGSLKENQQFARRARGALYETKYWLQRANRRKLLSKDEMRRLAPLLRKLISRLNAYLNMVRPAVNSSG